MRLGKELVASSAGAGPRRAVQDEPRPAARAALHQGLPVMVASL